MTAIVRWFAVGSLILLTTPVLAQVVYPPKPEKYDVHIRYRIRTDRDERIRQFRAMQSYLKDAGFIAVRRANDDLDIFNPDAEYINGSIPAAGAAKLLAQPSIQTVVMLPAGSKALADPKAVTQVRIGIRHGFPLSEQRRLHEQIVDRLGKLGFREAVAYDHQQFQTVRGAMPAGEVLALLKDLRTLPAGYFLGPVASDEVPQPFASVLPIQSVEVLADLAASTVTENDPGIVTSELAALLAEPGALDRPLTVEVIYDPALVNQASMRGRVRTAGLGATLNGVVGSVATVRLMKGSALANVLKIPSVLRVRLPREANETVLPVADASGPDFVVTSRASDLQKLGYTGTGTRVVVIGSSFEGWEKHVGKALPSTVKYLDLTAETDTALLPLPVQAGRVSGGLPAAIAAHRAAPGATLHLVRIDPAQLHQLQTVLRAVSGDTSLSIAQAARVDEASVKADQMKAARQRVNEEYRKAFGTLSDEPAAVAAREDALKKVRERQDEEAEYSRVVARYVALRAGVEALRNADVVANTLTWEVGFPHDGLNEIAKELEVKLHARAGLSALKAAKLPPPTGWVQAGGISTGQIWTGSWIDRDNNGVLEFDPTTTPVPTGTWTKELNFLDYAANGAKGAGTLPAGLKIRVSVQWREPHDPNGFPPDGAVFPMRVRLLRQADPLGKTHATDELIEVTRVQGRAVRIAGTRGSETFEHSFDFTIPTEGVYALRLEGSPRLESLKLGLTRNLEPRIRLFVEMLDPNERAKGRLSLKTYSNNLAGVGVPGDSVAALTMGTTDGKVITSLTGLGPGVTLGAKPDLTANATITVDGKTYGGTAVATGYAGGVCACLAELGVRPTDLIPTLGLKSGEPLALPAPWLSSLTPRAQRARER